jgi:maltooligosyltrehalose trehalohydrolase
MAPALGSSQQSPEVVASRPLAVRRDGDRRLPLGAEPMPAGGVHFRVWAPKSHRVAVERLDESGGVSECVPLTAEPDGYHAGLVETAHPGTLYRYRLDSGSFPDPASRFQPQGPHGPSEVVATTFEWTDLLWRGRPKQELVLYELHLGTFTPEGTWQAAAAQLPELARLGITAIEIMPVAEFAGEFGWGYDGVDLYAPSHLYGRPDDARAFVDRAHSLGVMVILDVVYNHIGPDGCYLREFSPDYFSTRYRCEWGDPLNFDGENAAPVREFFITNARYWIGEFHFDGLRLDATQQIFDASPVHLLGEITRAVRAAAPHRQTFVVGENEPQQAQLLRPRTVGGFELDAVWNDDFHHSAHVAATGHAEAYYLDYRGAPQEFISAAKRGYLFQGQLSSWQQKRRGSPALDLHPQSFVIFLQNHDQVANSLHGRRLHELTSPACCRAITALLLLSPSIPMLFQGQEFAASAPFLYFADHKPELAELVAQGRRTFLHQFRRVAADDARETLHPCCTPETFRRCVLDFRERDQHAPMYQLHIDLLGLRRDLPVFRAPDSIDGAVLGEQAFVLRYFHAELGDRLLIVNLGGDLRLNPAPEPLLGPMPEHAWSILWSSESPRYAGGGTPPLETQQNWIIPGPGAFVLAPDSNRELPRAKISETD